MRVRHLTKLAIKKKSKATKKKTKKKKRKQIGCFLGTMLVKHPFVETTGL